MAQNPITWDSMPDYDGWFIDSYWDCNDWITWYNELKNHYGDVNAKTVWLNAYHQAGFGAASYDCRSFNSPFKNFLYQEGLYDQVHTWFSVPLSAGTSLIEQSGKLIQSTSEGLGISSKIIKFIIPAALIYIVYRLTKRL